MSEHGVGEAREGHFFSGFEGVEEGLELSRVRMVGDVAGVVRCFLPDLARRDGSYDFVLGGDQENGQPTVRVIDDFIPPRVSPAP